MSRESARSPWLVPLVVVGIVAVATVVAVVVGQHLADGGDAVAQCGRSASVPVADDGTVVQVQGGTQVTVGTASLGLAGISDDGCAVRVGTNPDTGEKYGDDGWAEVGERIDIGGTTAMVLAVSRVADPGDAPGSPQFYADVWYATP